MRVAAQKARHSHRRLATDAIQTEANVLFFPQVVSARRSSDYFGRSENLATGPFFDFCLDRLFVIQLVVRDYMCSTQVL